MDVEDDHRGALVAEQAGDHLLQLEIDGQRHFQARLALGPRQFADHPAEGVDLDLAVAAGSTQGEVVDPLDTSLADAETRQFEQRIPGQIVFRDCGDITQDVRRRLRERIVAALALVDGNAGQARRIDLDAGDFLPVEVLAHGDRHEAALAADLAQHPLLLVVGDVDDPPDSVEGGLDVAGLLTDDQGPVVLPVDGDGNAAAVDDVAARRW